MVISPLWFLLSTLCGLSARMGIFEVIITDEEKLSKVVMLASELNWDFWKQPFGGKLVKFITRSDIDNIRYIRELLEDVNITMKIINDNLDETVLREIKESSVQRAKANFLSSNTGVHTYFASHKEYNGWLQSLMVSYPDFISLINIGKTYEDRDMIIIKLSIGRGRRSIFLEGGIHAREWLAVSSVVWIINKMIVGYKNKDSTVQEVLDQFDVYFLPITNPDGYEISRLGGKNRMWRKNAMPVGNGCKGIDLNRNFDINFTNTPDPCSMTYSGIRPFSAPETQNVRDFILSVEGRLRLFISFHAYSQMLFTPWAYTTITPIDNDELMRVAKIMVDAIYNISHVVYEVGSPANILYAASGGCYDWVKLMGVKYSYTFEVRPTENNWRGFIAPIEWIKPTGEELYYAVISAAKAIK